MKELKFFHNGAKFDPIINRNTYILKYPCSSKTDCSSIESTLPAGQYLLETWGAQGGSMEKYQGGRGGYSRGILNLRSNTKAFFYIGAEGVTVYSETTFTGFAFNGGGIGRSDRSNAKSATSGGGGTDIRLVEDSVYNRVIVSGGGGGSSKAYNGCEGGNGGGTSGSIGTKCSSNATLGGPGTQTQGGYKSGHGTGGSFWSGGNRTDWDGCGGGGGWFGGADSHGFVTSGSGGSGFIFNSTNYANAMSANLRLPTKYFLKEGFMIQGNENMPTPTGHNMEIGHYGDGAISITFVGNNNCTMKVQISRHHLFAMIIIISS